MLQRTAQAATPLTFDDMLRFATEAWGPLGANTVRVWSLYNERYFGGVLKPIPLVITQTMPFGRRLAFCSHYPNGGGRTITVNVPGAHEKLLAADLEALKSAFEAISELRILRSAMRAVAQLPDVPDAVRAAFFRVWLHDGDSLRSETNDDRTLTKALRVLLPPYTGGPLTLYRGAAASLEPVI
jgi:hypothetical protein